MTVIAMDCAPQTIRGELTRWMLEIKPGVFVGNINVKIRDLLWLRLCESRPEGNGAVMVFSTNNEQGFAMRLCGNPKRTVVDLEGIQVIQISNGTDLI